jgi:CDGSH-type Zn-finger protein
MGTHITNLPKVAICKSIKRVLSPGLYNICSCGLSSSQPFCDSSHQGTGFKPVRLKVEETKRYSLCGCKHSLTMPICDGEHKKLPGYVPPTPTV